MDCKKQTEKFNAEQFVDYLLEEGSRVPCDETVDSFSRNETLPSFYDEKLYKRGQQFFYDNIFALFLGKFFGLVTILSVPTIVKILIFTRMSGVPFAAYKRYMATIYHMCMWYESDFSPGSRLWRSLKDVKNLHNSASKRGCAAGINRISQRDMALTQFGFMGYALAKREKIGLFHIKDEDWRAFVHIWRIVGHVMGIEERFNICRDSVEETTEICNLLIEKCFRPLIEKSDDNFTTMASSLIDGMWVMNPTLNFNVIMCRIHELVEVDNNNNRILAKDRLTLTENMLIYVSYFVTWSLQFSIFRLFHNYLKLMALWLMKHFPFLAFYTFGYARSDTYKPFEIYNKYS